MLTVGETRANGDDPETIVQSSQRRTVNSSRQKKKKLSSSPNIWSDITAMFIATFEFFDIWSICMQIDEQRKYAVKNQKRENQSRCFCDNAPAHSTLSIRAFFGIPKKCTNEYLLIYNIHLTGHYVIFLFWFPRLKTALKGQRFEDVNDTIV